jgi:hypothetical protein
MNREGHLMLARLSGASSWPTIAGTVILLLGLGLDAVLHKLDPSLAAREGVFAVHNPGHFVAGVGIVLTVCGAVLFLIGTGLAWRSRSMLRSTALGGAALSLVALATASLLVAATTEATHEHAAGATGGHGHDGGVAVSAEQLENAARFVSQVRSSAARFEDINAAFAEGYVQSTPGMRGFPHFHNRRYASDGRILDPERPESLVYYQGPNGDRKLVGTLFLMPSGQQGPQFGGPLTVWHAHANACYNAQQTRLAGFANAQGQCRAGTILRETTAPMLHVWLVDHPGGVFADEMEPTDMLGVLSDAGWLRERPASFAPAIHADAPDPVAGSMTAAPPTPSIGARAGLGEALRGNLVSHGEWVSLGVPVSPERPRTFDGSQATGRVAATRLGSAVSVDDRLKVSGQMAVAGSSGGLMVGAPDGNRRALIQSVNSGAEYRVSLLLQGSERGSPVLSLPGGERGPFALSFEADGQHGDLVFSDGTAGSFDLGQSLYDASGPRSLQVNAFVAAPATLKLDRLELFGSPSLAAR